MKHLKKFENHTQYENYINGSGAILPNVSICVTEVDVHYSPFMCDETSVWDVIGEPSYPSTIEGDATSFDITVNYRRTDTNSSCTEVITEGTDTITVECEENPSTSSTRTITGTVDYHGNEIEYNITQNQFEYAVIGKFNVTNTTNPTRIASGTSNFTKIKIDGVPQESVTSGYTFDTTGEHIVKYYLNSTSIGSQAFKGCSALTSVEIPDTVTSIGSSAFSQCYELININIPSGVTSIGSSAFYNCGKLTSVEIPNTVTSIGNSAFTYCYKLATVNIPSGVTYINDSTFRQCRSITNINIPSGVTSIGDNAFNTCSGLTNIDLPSNLTNIGISAFSDCDSVTSIVIPNSVTNLGNYAFEGCNKLASVTLPNRITAIGDGVFWYCVKLTSIGLVGSGASIEIPNTVTSIGGDSFNSCSGLITVTLPNSVTWIGMGAFYSCTGLTSITINATTPPRISTMTLPFMYTNDCPIYVPSGSVDAYKSASGWKNYASRIQAIS